MKAVGKQIGYSLYLHRSAIEDPKHLDLIEKAMALFRTTRGQSQDPIWSVAKFTAGSASPVRSGPLFGPSRVSLLDYPRFFEDGFPILSRAHTFTCDDQGHPIRFTTRHYKTNPPILHRKELLLSTNHPDLETYCALTQACEKAGLFKDAKSIGRHDDWFDLIALKDLIVVGHRLFAAERLIEDKP